MDKNAIKKYAVWARRELISRVSQRAALYEITDIGFGDASADSVLGRVMSAEEKRQRQALIAQIREKGYEQVMEEIAYTWFNRFIALRFMEVNGYLPSRVRVFTDDDNNFRPQILTEAINIELDGLDMEKVYALKNANDDDALFKYMIIVQCNTLSSILPGMFQRISDFTELLFPDNLLREGSVIEQMVSTIPEEDWTDQVQIIGWLYQYYNTEPKDKVFADLKKNIKVSKESIPAATQLFTLDWIVRYMVENSLGRLWLEGHPNDELKASWKYYLDDAVQEPEVQAQLADIRKEYAAMKPEDILAIDPCQGSGHILAYMFDVLVQIYESYGYTAREAAASIVEHNIWGLDIDDRAAQLAYFSVMMKARQYDRRFFSRGIQPHVYAIRESNNIDQSIVDYFENGRPELRSSFESLIRALKDAKDYGSIIDVPAIDYSALFLRIEEIRSETSPSLYSYQAVDIIEPIILLGQAMSQKYHIVITNPPYMGGGNMNQALSNYARKSYPDSRSDLSTIFMEKTLEMCLPHGLMSMINIPVWMFLSSYEKLRGKLLRANTLVNMVHPGRGIFGSDFGTTTFVFRKGRIKGFSGVYCRLFDEQVEVKSPETREEQYLSGKGRFITQQEKFAKIPGEPIAYWVSDSFANMFLQPSIRDIAFAGIGMRTGDNDRFLRVWFEVDKSKFFPSCSSAADALQSHAKWIPYNKGGEFRRWYGNNEYVVNWENDGFEIKENTRKVYPQLGDNLGWKISNERYYFREGITWTVVSSKYTSFRRYYDGAIISNSGQSVIADDSSTLDYLTGLLNTNLVRDILAILSPTIGFESGYINKIPVIISSTHKREIVELVNECIRMSKADWDSFETSWDFKEHPFLHYAYESAAQNREITLAEAFELWKKASEQRFNSMKEKESAINRIFNEIYGLEEELPSEVDEKDISVRKPDWQREVKSLISYAVGCMFGRYSLGTPGITYAGGTWDISKFKTFKPDEDGIIPICDDEYFEDDIVGRFIAFLRTAFGESVLEENLRLVAEAIGGKGSSREVIRSYFLNCFYADHCSTYAATGSGKRPIYWLFDSGKKNGFKCLIYMHRYQPDTIARIRTDYVHEQQSRYRTAIADLESRIATAGTSERVKLSKHLTKLQEQAEELRVYEEKIHHLADKMIRIDLDDGVKHNYAIFQDVLAKIK